MSQRTGRLTRGAALLAALGLVLSMASAELAVAKTAKKTTKKAAAKTTKKAAKTTKKPTTTTAKPSKGTVKIGALGASTSSVTGARTTEEARKVAQAWETQVNAAGGINGYKVEVVYKDNGADTARTLSAVKDLDKEGVLAVAGQQVAAQLAAVMSTVESRKLPLIGGKSVFEGADTSPMFFYASGGTSDANNFGLGKALYDAGAKSVRVVYCSDLPQCADAAPKIVDTMKSLGGTGSTTTASRTAVDYTSSCLGAKKDGVDALTLLAVPLATVVRDCQRQNYHPIYQQGSALAFNQASIDLLGGERYFGASPQIPLLYKGPELAGFRTIISKTDLAPTDVTQVALETYMGFEMVRVILNKMTETNPTRADFLAAAYTVKGETLGGLLPPRGVDYTGQKNGGKHSTLDCWTQWGLFDGEWRASNKAGAPTNSIEWQCGTIFAK